MTGVILSGIEKNEFGECPLYSKTFRWPGEAMNYAKAMFHLSGWRERATGFWEITTRDRYYKIETKEVNENDLEQ